MISDIAARERSQRGTAALRFKRAKAKLATFSSDENGTAFVLAMVIFTLMVVMGGLAVDVARMEAQRITIQQTADRAVLAAADLDNPDPPKQVVEDYFAKAGLSQFLDKVTVTDSINSKSVRAETTADVETVFLRMVGVDSLAAVASGAALEQVSDIEISLVVDVSGSMDGTRISTLRTAAGIFFDTVMDNGPDKPGLTSISIVPYNAHVNLGADLAKHVNFDNSHNYSNCGRFRDDGVRNDFSDTAIDSDTFIERIGHFENYGGSYSYNDPKSEWYWCEHDDNRTILVHETDPQVLKDHINAFWADGWTAIDQGMRWGAALLDPAFEEVLADMVDDTSLSVPSEVKGRPAAFDDQGTMKIIVLMTDGENTVQRDYPDWMKNNMSPVWFSQNAANATGRWYDGYYVDLNHELTPSSEEVPGSVDWYRPRDPDRTSDDQWMGFHNQSDAVRLSYNDLLSTFMREDLQKMMWRYADYDSRNSRRQSRRPKHWDYDQHNDMQIVHTDTDQADQQSEDFCDLINDDTSKRIQIFTIAFQAPSGGEEIMKKCASTLGHYYDVDNTDLAYAFRSIASQINHLRLIE